MLSAGPAPELAPPSLAEGTRLSGKYLESRQNSCVSSIFPSVFIQPHGNNIMFTQLEGISCLLGPGGFALRPVSEVSG